MRTCCRFLLAFLILSAAWPVGARAEPGQARGTVERAACGLDSAVVKIRLQDGSLLRFAYGPAVEQGGQSLPTQWPSVLDAGSTVHVWYRAGVGDQVGGVAYQVLRRPAQMFGVVVASLPGDDGMEAFVAQLKAEREGLPAGRFSSSDHPTLRPGYMVVVAGVSPVRSRAEALLEQARRAGYKDAYLRRIW